MQDNHQDWTADSNFWDEAWKDMEQRLDQALPQRKARRSRLAWWWLGLGLLIAVAASAAWYLIGGQNGSAPSNDVTTPIHTSPAHVSPPVANETTISASDTATARPLLSTPITPLAVSQLEGSKLEGQKTNRQSRQPKQAREQLSSRHSLADYSFTAEVAQQTASTVSISPPLLLPALVENEASVQLLRAPLHPLVALPLLAPTAPLASMTTTPNPTYPIITIRKLANWQWGLSATNAFDWAQPRLGFEVAVFGAKSLGNKTQLVANLGYVARNETFNTATLSRFENNPSASTDSNSVTQLYNLALGQARFNQTNYIYSQRLRLGFGVNQTLRPRWELGVQAGASYLVGGRVPRFFGILSGDLSSSTGGNFEGINADQLSIEFERFQNVNESGETLANSSGGLHPATGTHFRRWDIDLQSRLAYRLSPQLALFGVAQYSFQPLLSRDIVHFRPWRGQLGLRWTFL